MWGYGFGIVGWIFRLIGRFLAFLWNAFAGLFNRLRLRSTLRGIQADNDATRNVELLNQAIPVSSVLSDVTPGGKVVISGYDAQKSSPWRNLLTQRTVERVAQSNVGVVVLHAGDGDLVARLEARVNPSRLVVVDASHRAYDPLRDYSARESAYVLCEGLGDEGDSFRSAKLYLEGMILAMRYCRKRQPNLETLRRLSDLSHSQLMEQLEKCLNTGRINQAQYDRVDECLGEGLSGRTYVKDFIKSLCMQLKGVIPDDVSFRDADMVSIGRALRDGKVLVLDVRDATRHKLCYGLLMNELLMALNKHGPGYLVIDNLPFGECPEMLRMLTEGRSGLGVCVSAADLFARCGSKQERMNDVVSGSECCVAFRHEEGRSAQAWQEKYGRYRKKDISWNMSDGGMRPNPFTMFPGRHSSMGYSFVDKDEYRILEGEIQKLADGVAIITRRDESHVVIGGLIED